MTEQCSLCRYFKSQFENEGSGFCCRFPPFPDGWPEVRTTEYCGEFSSAAIAASAEAASELKAQVAGFVPNAFFLPPSTQEPCAHQKNKTKCEDCEEFYHPSGKCKICNGGTLYQLAKHLCPPQTNPDKCITCKHFMKPEQGRCIECVEWDKYEGLEK